MAETDERGGGTDRPERRLIGSKLSAQHVLDRGEEIEPGVYRIEYGDDPTVIAELTYAVITEVREDDSDREEPARSEPADFGYGESTGVQDL